jgi:hypothetical protein
VLALVAALGQAPARAAVSDLPLLGVGSPDFVILSPDGAREIGQIHYSIIRRSGVMILRGEDRFNDGQYDIETSRLSVPAAGALPALIEFNHMFYTAEGSVLLEAHADVRTGLASCIDRRSGDQKLSAAKIDFPAQTWAGASVILPIQRFLRDGSRGNLTLNVFNCAPSPKVLAVAVEVAPRPRRLPGYLPGAVEIDAHPDFGWLNFIVEPFVPKLHAWFDPAREWEFVGAMLSRYYSGPQILMVTARARPKPGARAVAK